MYDQDNCVVTAMMPVGVSFHAFEDFPVLIVLHPCGKVSLLSGLIPCSLVQRCSMVAYLCTAVGPCS